MRTTAVGTIAVAAFTLVVGAAEAQSGWEEWDVEPRESVWASSVLTETLDGRDVSYPPVNLFDEDPATPWVEGAEGSGVGEHVTVLTERPVDSLEIVNGFARSERLFRRNARPRELRLVLVAAFTAPGLVSELDVERYFAREIGPPVTVELADTPEPQRVAFTVPARRQMELYRSALEEFLHDHDFFAEEMARQLGFPPAGDLTDAERAQFLDLAQTAFAMLCLRVEITGVYEGTHYDDSCISEIDVRFR